MRFLPALTFMLIFSTSLPAWAKAPINDAGAARVKALVQSMIDQQSMMHNSQSNKIVTQGDIKVEQASSYYAVTLPDITSITQYEKDGETKKFITKIGIIGMNVIPTDNSKEWKMSVAIPTPIKYLDGNEKTLAQLDIGQQQMIGLWNEDLNAFAEFNGQYRDLLIHNNQSAKNAKTRVKINNFTLKSNVKESGDNLWSGPSKFTISDFFVEAQPDIESAFQPVFSVDKMEIAGSVKDFKPEAQTQIQKIFSNLGNEQPADPTTLKNIFPLLLSMLDSVAFKMSLEGFKITPNEKMLSQEPLELQKAFFGFGLSGLKQNMMSNNFSFGWHGLSGTKDQAKENNTIPTTMSFSFALDKLPLAPLINMGNQLASSGANKDNIAQMAMMNAMMMLPQKLSEAGTTIRIKDTMLKHPNYKFNFDGHLKADQASVIGVNGEATIEALGLNNAITMLERQRAEIAGDAAKEEKVNKLLEQLQTLKIFLQDDPNGSDLKTVKFVLDNQGQTLVNGVNIKEIKN